MRPEPQFGLSADGLLKQSQIAQGQGHVAAALLCVGLHLQECQAVVSARSLLYVQIDELCSYLVGYLLCTTSVPGGLVQEGDSVLFLSGGTLVLDESAEEGFAFGFPFQHGADGLVHLYLLGVPAAADFVHERGKVGAFYLLVYLRPLLRVPVADADFLIPLPAAQVTEQHEDVLALGGYAFGQFAIQHFHAAEHLFVGDVEALEGFDEDVAEVVVEGPLDAEDFLFALLGEGAAEVLADQSAPIPYYIIYEREGNVAQQIQYAQGQPCQEAHEAMSFLCSVLVHSHCVSLDCSG